MDITNTTQEFFNDMNTNDWGYMLFGGGLVGLICCIINCIKCLC